MNKQPPSQCQAISPKEAVHCSRYEEGRNVLRAEETGTKEGGFERKVEDPPQRLTDDIG
jgi:hypothetical protein